MRRKLLNSGNLSLQVIAFDFCYLSVYCIAGGTTLQENNHSVGLGNCFAFRCHRLHEQIVKYVAFFDHDSQDF